MSIRQHLATGGHVDAVRGYLVYVLNNNAAHHTLVYVVGY